MSLGKTIATILIGGIISLISLGIFIVWTNVTEENGTSQKWRIWQRLLFIPAAIGILVIYSVLFV